MSLEIKSLADDQLEAVSTDPADTTFSYTAPASRSAILTSVRIANADNTVTATVKVECKVAAGSRDTSGSPAYRKVAPANISVAPNDLFTLAEQLVLGAGDEIRVTLVRPGSGTAKIDVVISGSERY